MNTTNYTSALSTGSSEGSNGSKGWPAISVSWRDAVWLSAGFGFGALTTMCLVLACRRCRRHRRRGGNPAESNAENNAGGNGVML